ncbi:hypothetical protein BH20CHL3_BH20CHL3_03570 [soil metagenome]
MSPKWKATLQAARNEASLAVTLYNDASQSRSFEGFVVHMHLGWLYLLHAQFQRDGVDYRYWESPTRLAKIDGEVKRWELSRCVNHKWESEEPIRKNIEFFIGLRNKIEHRHSQFDAYLALAVGGKAQALLLNFESELTSCFSEEWSMASVLRFPIFVGTFTEAGTATLLHLRDKIPVHLKRYIADFHSGLSDDIQDDPKFEVRLHVILQKVNRDLGALAMQFVNWNDLNEDEREAYELLSKRGLMITREKTQPIVNDGRFLPGDVVTKVQASIRFKFNMSDFVASWQQQCIRPAWGAGNPSSTDARYCVYDSLHRSYSYNMAWVERLIRKCQTADGYLEMVGHPGRPKDLVTQESNLGTVEDMADYTPPRSSP